MIDWRRWTLMLVALVFALTALFQPGPAGASAFLETAQVEAVQATDEEAAAEPRGQPAILIGMGVVFLAWGGFSLRARQKKSEHKNSARDQES